MLEQKIEALGGYFDGMFRLPEGYNGVRICIPENWIVYEEKNDEFTITPTVVNDNNTRKMMLIGSPKAKIIDIMNFAYKIIVSNLENEKKKQLFQVRLKELANIFDNNELSKLETLVFSFGKVNESKPNKNNKKGKKETAISVPIETNNQIEDPIKKAPVNNSDKLSEKIAEIKKLSQEK